MNKPKNLFTNSFVTYAQVAITLSAGMLQSRFLLLNLGIVDFGIYSLVGGFIAFFAFINTAMAVSTQRQLSFALGKEEDGVLNKAYSMSIIIHLIICLAFIALSELFGIHLLRAVINVPSERLWSVEVLFHISVLSFSLLICGVPFQAVLAAYEDFTALSSVLVFRSCAVCFSAYAISFSLSNRLERFGLAVCVVYFLEIVIFLIMIRKKHSNVRCHLHGCLKGIGSELEYSSWNFLAALSVAGKSQGVGIVVNSNIGAIGSAAYGISNQVAGMMTSFSQAIGKVVAPRIVKLYSVGQIEKTRDIVYSSTSYIGVVGSMIAIPLLLETPLLLRWWLGSIPKYAIELVRVAVIIALIDSLSLSLMSLAQATGKIRKYMISNSIILLFCIPVSILLFRLNFDVFHVMLSVAFISIVLHASRVVYLKSMAGLSVYKWIAKVIAPSVCCFICGTFFAAIPFFTFKEGIMRLVVIVLLSITGSCFAFLAIKGEERCYVLKLLKKKLNAGGDA